MKFLLTFLAAFLLATGAACYVTDYDYNHRTDNTCVGALVTIFAGAMAAAMARYEEKK